MSNWKMWAWPMLVCGCLAGLVTVGLSQSPPDKESGDKAGRYQAVSAGNTVILLDTATGKTWRTLPNFPFGGAGEEFWAPMTKFDTPEEYRKWRDENKKLLFRDKTGDKYDGPKDFPPKEKRPPFPDKDGPPKDFPFKEKGPIQPFKEKGPPIFKDKLPALDKGPVDRKLD